MCASNILLYYYKANIKNILFYHISCFGFFITKYIFAFSIFLVFNLNPRQDFNLFFIVLINLHLTENLYLRAEKKRKTSERCIILFCLVAMHNKPSFTLPNAVLLTHTICFSFENVFKKLN